MPQRFKFLFADDANIFGVKDTGELLQWSTSDTSLLPLSSTDAAALNLSGVSGTQVGTDWAAFVRVFAGGDGIVYAIKANGDLLAYKYNRQGGWAYEAALIGSGWADFVHVLCDLKGGIFAVKADGNLLYYKHTGRTKTPATAEWENGGAAQVVGSGFNHPFVFFGAIDAQNRRSLRAISQGKLRFISALTDTATTIEWENAGAGVECSVSGDPMTGADQWGMFTHVFAGGNGVMYGVTCEEFGQALYKFITPPFPTPSVVGTRLSPTHATTMQFGWQCIPIEGYAWPMSGASGETLRFYVSTAVPGGYQLTFARLGSAGPLLPRTVDRGYSVTAVPYQQSGAPIARFQVSASKASANGAGWSDSFVIVVPPTSEWKSGFYVARCTAPTGYAYDIPFIVKPNPTLLSGAGRPGDIAVIANVNCWNAYNTWGGYSNYNGGNAKTLSYKRPNHHLLTAFTDHDAGTHLLKGEIWVFEWMQQTYPSRLVHLYTDIDIHNSALTNDASFLDAYKCVVIDTHPEYWTPEMFKRFDAYVKNGGHILYLGGNAAYRGTEIPSDGEMKTTGKDAPDPGVTNSSLLGITIGTLHADSGAFNVTLGADPIFAGMSGNTFGESGWNNIHDNGAAAGWETETITGAQTELASAGDGCKMGRYTPDNDNGGWAVGIGSLRVGGSLRADANLQIIVKNVLSAAGVTVSSGVPAS